MASSKSKIKRFESSFGNGPLASETKDWEDEYYRLKSKFEALKVDYNEKEQHNKL